MGLGMLRFAVVLTGFLAGLVWESRGSADPITIEPRALHRRPADDVPLALVR